MRREECGDRLREGLRRLDLHHVAGRPAGPAAQPPRCSRRSSASTAGGAAGSSAPAMQRVGTLTRPSCGCTSSRLMARQAAAQPATSSASSRARVGSAPPRAMKAGGEPALQRLLHDGRHAALLGGGCPLRHHGPRRLGEASRGSRRPREMPHPAGYRTARTCATIPPEGQPDHRGRRKRARGEQAVHVVGIILQAMPGAGSRGPAMAAQVRAQDGVVPGQNARHRIPAGQVEADRMQQDQVRPAAFHRVVQPIRRSSASLQTLGPGAIDTAGQRTRS